MPGSSVHAATGIAQSYEDFLMLDFTVDLSLNSTDSIGSRDGSVMCKFRSLKKNVASGNTNINSSAIKLDNHISSKPNVYFQAADESRQTIIDDRFTPEPRQFTPYPLQCNRAFSSSEPKTSNSSIFPPSGLYSTLIQHSSNDRLKVEADGQTDVISSTDVHNENADVSFPAQVILAQQFQINELKRQIEALTRVVMSLVSNSSTVNATSDELCYDTTRSDSNNVNAEHDLDAGVSSTRNSRPQEEKVNNDMRDDKISSIARIKSINKLKNKLASSEKLKVPDTLVTETNNRIVFESSIIDDGTVSMRTLSHSYEIPSIGVDGNEPLLNPNSSIMNSSISHQVYRDSEVSIFR